MSGLQVTRAAALAHTPRHPVALAFALGCAAPALLLGALAQLPDPAFDRVIRALSWRPGR